MNIKYKNLSLLGYKINHKFKTIGMFDSGIGGLTVYNELKQRFPKINIIFVADRKHMPYGNKSSRRIKSYLVKIIHYLISVKCELI